MNPSLRILEHLSHVLECVTIDAIGEAKTELDLLAECVETDKAYSIENRTLVVAQLREALSLFRDRRIGQGSNILGILSRELWSTLNNVTTD